MKKEEIKTRLREILANYIADYDELKGRDLQIVFNPAANEITVETADNRLTDMYDSQAALEAAAASQGDSDEQAADYQVEVNPIQYPIRKLVREYNGSALADEAAIERVAEEIVENA